MVGTIVAGVLWLISIWLVPALIFTGSTLLGVASAELGRGKSRTWPAWTGLIGGWVLAVGWIVLAIVQVILHIITVVQLATV